MRLSLDALREFAPLQCPQWYFMADKEGRTRLVPESSVGYRERCEGWKMLGKSLSSIDEDISVSVIVELIPPVDKISIEFVV